MVNVKLLLATVATLVGTSSTLPALASNTTILTHASNMTLLAQRSNSAFPNLPLNDTMVVGETYPGGTGRPTYGEIDNRYDNGPDEEWLHGGGTCRNKAIIARAAWRVECRWNMHSEGDNWLQDFNFCGQNAPSESECCYGHHSPGCTRWWPGPDHVGDCRENWTRPPGEPGSWPFEDMKCMCLWHPHCGNW